MSEPQIPFENPDLRDIVRASNRRFLCKWLCTTAAILLVEVFFLFPTAAGYVGWVQAALLCAALLVIPFVVFGGPAWVRDTSFVGTVISTQFSVRLEAFSRIGGGIGKGGRPYASTRGYNQVNYCKMAVRLDDGSVRTRTVRLPGDSETFPLREGDRIVKFRGLPYPVILGCKTPFCVVCGHMDDDGKGECRGCGCSLIVLTDDEMASASGGPNLF